MLLAHDDQAIVRSDLIESILPFDEPEDQGTEKRFRLLFILSNDGDAEWSFPTADARDAALAEVRKRLDVQVI